MSCIWLPVGNIIRHLHVLTDFPQISQYILIPPFVLSRNKKQSFEREYIKAWTWESWKSCIKNSQKTGALCCSCIANKASVISIISLYINLYIARQSEILFKCFGNSYTVNEQYNSFNIYILLLFHAWFQFIFSTLNC